MANMAQNIRSYADAERFLGNRLIKKLGHNTTVHRTIGRIFIRYHATNIVTYWADGRISMNTNGWMTSTTKQRLNACTPFGVYSDGPDCWAVVTPGATWDTPRDSARFEDDMTSDPSGAWQNHKADRFAARKLNRRNR